MIGTMLEFPTCTVTTVERDSLIAVDICSTASLLLIMLLVNISIKKHKPERNAWCLCSLDLFAIVIRFIFLTILMKFSGPGNTWYSFLFLGPTYILRLFRPFPFFVPITFRLCLR